jgi:hypothetical protein
LFFAALGRYELSGDAAVRETYRPARERSTDRPPERQGDVT